MAGKQGHGHTGHAIAYGPTLATSFEHSSHQNLRSEYWPHSGPVNGKQPHLTFSWLLGRRYQRLFRPTFPLTATTIFLPRQAAFEFPGFKLPLS